MFRGAFCLYLSLLLIPAAIAGQNAPENTISVWEVRDSDNVVYLAGSVHLLRESDLPIPKGYFLAFQDCEHIHFELDMALISQPAMKARMIELGKLPKTQKLSGYLSPQTLRKLRRHVAARGIPGRSMDRLKPGMVLLTLSALSAREMGASPDNGVESLIYQRCIETKKTTSGLETPEFQLSMFDEFSPEVLEELINEAIEDTAPDEELVENLITAWKNGDSGEIDRLITDDSEHNEQIREVIMTRRNRSWLPVIEKSIRGKRDEMFVVGAGHLVGKDGIVQMLERKGYRVRQLSNDSLMKLSQGARPAPVR